MITVYLHIDDASPKPIQRNKQDSAQFNNK